MWQTAASKLSVSGNSIVGEIPVVEWNSSATDSVCSQSLKTIIKFRAKPKNIPNNASTQACFASPQGS